MTESIHSAQTSVEHRRTRRWVFIFAMGIFAIASLGSAWSQQAAPTPDPAEIQRQIQAISAQLNFTQRQLEESQQQILKLQAQLLAMQQQLAATPVVAPPISTSSSATTLAQVAEQQEVIAAEVKQHDQSKVETISKYPLRVTGLVLLNAFINRGIVDQSDLPSIASPAVSGTSNASVGASFRQTFLGIQATGPRFAGARTSADLDIDFYGGIAYNDVGTSAGIVRFRTASLNLDWQNDTLQLGFTGPLVSPLSPTSYASVSEPALASSGNLWTWAPQLRYQHRQVLPSTRHLSFELGLWDPPSAGYNTSTIVRSPSPGEQSSQPAFEGRISLASPIEDGFQLGLGGYYSRQSYPYSVSIDSYAVTTDWRLPLNRHLELSGEAYRGRAIGGLGGGEYKDILSGLTRTSGAYVYRPLNAIGGWAQLKVRFAQSLQANASLGLDDAFARDFHSIVLLPGGTPVDLRARNRTLIANLIFSPKTYIVLSPEYRRIWTWPISGAVSTAKIFTMSVGYHF